MTLQSDNSLRAYRVLRPMYYMGRICAVGDELRLPRSLAVELQSAAKIEPAPEPAPAADPAPPAAAPKRKRAEVAP